MKENGQMIKLENQFKKKSISISGSRICVLTGALFHKFNFHLDSNIYPGRNISIT